MLVIYLGNIMESRQQFCDVQVVTTDKSVPKSQWGRE